MISEGQRNLLEADVDALVNTVNTVGVIGKGVALQFRRAFPAMFEDYARAAKAGRVELGRMHVWPTGTLSCLQFVINFPTKQHWRAQSRLADIERSLSDLVRIIGEREISAIAIPVLGCGNGGLDWRDVDPRIRAALSEVAEVDTLLYPPDGAPRTTRSHTAGFHRDLEKPLADGVDHGTLRSACKPQPGRWGKCRQLHPAAWCGRPRLSTFSACSMRGSAAPMIPRCWSGRQPSAGCCFTPEEHWCHNGTMKRMNLRDVPDDVYDTLAGAAEANRQSLSAFVVDRLTEVAEMTRIDDYVGSYLLPQGSGVTLEDAAEAVREVREAS